MTSRGAAGGLPHPHRMKLALFDLDHTLLPIDSDYAWGVFTQDIGWCDPVEFKARNDAFFAQYQTGTLDVHEYVRFATQALRERGPEQAEAARQRFMQSVIGPALRAQARELVERHRAAGDHLVIITATNEFVTRPIADALGIDDLIAVRLARGDDGWYTGDIDGVPSMREGKVTRFEEWLSARGLGWGDVDTTFYSDSMNDLPLLERVRCPVATNPDARLRQVARERGWPILDLFENKQ